jgi:DNA gyrase inhibitor GyrI
MEEMEVRIVTLEPMKVICFHGFGASPEAEAYRKLTAWKKGKGLTQDDTSRRVFGFNNPSPSPGSPNYGYDLWITAEEGEAGAKEFAGGLYAVTRCDVRNPQEDIESAWQKLVVWREKSKYGFGAHQWLEEHIPSDAEEVEFVLDLYMPIH